MTIEGLGKKFQEARIARGLTLDEAARLTKIRPSRLAEIEADDFSQFPSLAYAKGFLLIYGKFLDVDVSPYLDVFETSREVTVDGYSYLQDQPAPKPRRVRPTRAPAVHRERMSRGGDRRSPVPVLIGVGVIILGFILMRLIMNIQRISPHQMVGVPQPTAAESAPPQAVASQPQPAATKAVAQQTPPPQAPAASVAPAPVAQAPSRAPAQAPVTQAPSRAPSQAPVAMVEATKKPAPPVTTPAPSIPIPEAFVPAFANADAAAKASAAPTKEPEVRRAEPVRPEDLAKAAATQTTQKPVRSKDQIRLRSSRSRKPTSRWSWTMAPSNPHSKRWISPSDGGSFRGQKIAVRVLDRDAVQIKKNGKPVAGGDEDVVV